MTSAPTRAAFASATGVSTAGAPTMQRVVGREAGADLEVGDDARIELLGQRNAGGPCLHAARGPARQYRQSGARDRGHCPHPLDSVCRRPGRDGWVGAPHIV